MSQVYAIKLREGYFISKEERDADSALKVKNLTAEDLWFNTVRGSSLIKRKEKNPITYKESIIYEEQFEGTSFIVADSRRESLLNHRNYLPFNYRYNPTHTEWSPKLYLVSNAHVLMQTPPDCYIGYIFYFHYARSIPDKDVVASDDFKIVRITIPISKLGIFSHGDDEDGHQIDLACFPLNRIFDALQDWASLRGYNPIFTAFDTQVHMTPCGSDYNLNALLHMFGYPDGQRDIERNLPLITRGYCSTHPVHLRCDNISWPFSQTAASKKSVVDFKMDISTIGGSSGSAIVDFTPSTARIIGILWGKHQTRLIGFVISAKRLKDWLENNTISVLEELLTLESGEFHEAPAPASGGGASAGIGSTFTTTAIRGPSSFSLAAVGGAGAGRREITDTTATRVPSYLASAAAGGAGAGRGALLDPAVPVLSEPAVKEILKDKISRTITIPKESQITRLNIKSGLYLDSLQLIYRDREGSTSNSFTIGGDGGAPSFWDFYEREYLIHISGMYNGEGLSHVIFRTNFGRVFGPFGTFIGEGKLFNSVTQTKNSKIEGEIGIADLLVGGSLTTTILPNSLYFLE